MEWLRCAEKARRVRAERTRERVIGEENQAVSLVDHGRVCGFMLMSSVRPISAAVSRQRGKQSISLSK